SAYLQKFGAKVVRGVKYVETPAVANINHADLQPQVRSALATLSASFQAKYGSPCLVHCGDAVGGAYDLVKYVLPGVVKSGSVTGDSVRAAALQVNVATGGTPQGFGLKLSPSTGDNSRAVSVIMQWQTGKLVVVYPQALASASPVFPMPTWSQR